MHNTTRKLMVKYETLGSGEFSLSDIKSKMENKIDCLIYPDESWLCMVYKRYESDAEYIHRLKKEERQSELLNDPEFQQYLKLKEKFYGY